MCSSDLDPGTGPLASPDEGAGPGRMREPEEILAAAARRLEPSGKLAGKRVVVTAGPTREPIDPVRFITNASSGRMGVAIAAAARRRGAEVTLVAGPIEVAPPADVRIVHVVRTHEMADAVRSALAGASALVMAAAPADFRPAVVADAKIKKAGGVAPIAMEPTDDILVTTRDARPKGCVVVGFALETNDVLAHAEQKLRAKGLDFIVANDAREPGAGFGTTTNRVTILAPGKPAEPLPLMSKDAVAEAERGQPGEAFPPGRRQLMPWHRGGRPGGDHGASVGAARLTASPALGPRPNAVRRAAALLLDRAGRGSRMAEGQPFLSNAVGPSRVKSAPS